MALFILFVIVLGIGAVFYMRFTKQTVPIGHVGVVEFMNARTQRGFREGDCFVPPLCKLILVDLRDRQIILPQEDTQAADSITIVCKGVAIRFRVRQDVKRSSRFKVRILRRIFPFNLGETIPNFPNIEGILEQRARVVAQATINTFSSTVGHEELLGYHVIRAAQQLLDGAGIKEVTRVNGNVEVKRTELCTSIKSALQQEFDDFGIEIVGIAIDDFAPSREDQAHLEEVARQVQGQQMSLIKTNVEVQNTLAIATAIVTFKKEHADVDFTEVYALMRRYDVWALAAEKGNLNLAIQALTQKFMGAAEAQESSQINAA
jgi:hypothetical protein